MLLIIAHKLPDVDIALSALSTDTGLAKVNGVSGKPGIPNVNKPTISARKNVHVPSPRRRGSSLMSL
ncbi:MAG: hypothetical protein KDJ52_07700 [Anaerolineae bacterium]|nr:hypothetical protein [Anaerolineae bacterium]